MHDGFAPMRDGEADPLRERAARLRAEREAGSHGPALGEALPSFPRIRGGDGDGAVGAGCCCLVFVLIIFNLFFSSLDPNEFGLLRNGLTGAVYQQVDRGGLHYTGCFSGYIRFPATQVTLQFSARSPDRPRIQARTGEDHNSHTGMLDQQGGGQPIQISCSFQFQIHPDSLRQIYLSFGSYAAAKARWLLLSGNMVSNVAQQFTPQEFWTDRPRIAAAMLGALNDTLATNGHVDATKFQILKIDFVPRFEDSITGVQVAEQQRVVNEYLQQVQEVVQTISVLDAENQAVIANISANADAYSRTIMANARRDAFNLKQNMKATKYAELQTHLNFESRHMAEYFKIKSLQSQGSRGKLVVGMAQVGSNTRSRSEL